MERLFQNEKLSVAAISVGAAVFLTCMKLVVGLLTNSLGVLSEALHSGLDLVAAVVTYFGVRSAAAPADETHHFGHGKIENLSALFETLLLLVTCIWIIWEAVMRLFFREAPITQTTIGIVVMVISIIIDFWRSRALSKAAKKYNSQALAADALHFSSDILSSSVVIVGLICVAIGFPEGDALAAKVYADAYNRNAEFFSFVRSLEAYKKSFNSKDDVLVIQPDNDFFKYMKSDKVQN